MKESNKSNEPRGWYSRGYLPHFDAGEFRSQFITCRLYDSLPQSVIKRITDEIEVRRPENVSREKFMLIEKYLDQGLGQCFLANREVAKIVKVALLKFDGERYKLFAWIIMPNHIHFLMRPRPGEKLEKMVHSIKSYTASACNKMLGRTGPFWMREPFDRYIRDENHFERTYRYIENNPVKAGLCSKAEDWEFSSAWQRRQHIINAITKLPQ